MSHDTNPPKKPNPLARDFLESKRRSAKGYACPFCTEVYHQEPKIWEHALQNHRASLGDLKTEEKTESARKQFRQLALDKAYVLLRPSISPDSTFLPTDTAPPASIDRLTWEPTRQNKAKSDKAAPAAADPPRWTPSSDWAQHAGRDIGEDVRPRSPTSPASAPESVQCPGTTLDHRGRLTLAQGRTGEQRNTSTSVDNSLKLGAEGESGSLEPPNESRIRGSMNPRSRHVKTHSGGTAVGGDPDFPSQSAQRYDSEFRRPIPQSKQPLWDSQTDSPDVNVRLNPYQGQYNSRRRFDPSNPFVSSPRGSRLPQQDDQHPMPGVGQPQFEGQLSNARSVQDQHSIPLYFN